MSRRSSPPPGHGSGERFLTSLSDSVETQTLILVAAAANILEMKCFVWRHPVTSVARSSESQPPLLLRALFSGERDVAFCSVVVTTSRAASPPSWIRYRLNGTSRRRLVTEGFIKDLKIWVQYFPQSC